VWDARKHGDLAASGAEGGICMGGSRTPCVWASTPRWPSNGLDLFPPPSDGHDQIMIEFCSINSLLDHLDHRGLSIMCTARSCSAIIEYTRASWFMTDHSTNLGDWVMR